MTEKNFKELDSPVGTTFPTLMASGEEQKFYKNMRFRYYMKRILVISILGIITKLDAPKISLYKLDR